jgi:hypothetical protein
MICYRDMTFCIYWADCAKAPECHRPLTPEVHEAAVRWYGGPDPPFSIFGEKPSCHTPKENNDVWT